MTAVIIGGAIAIGIVIILFLAARSAERRPRRGKDDGSDPGVGWSWFGDAGDNGGGDGGGDGGGGGGGD